jgi:hypothetical protein
MHARFLSVVISQSLPGSLPGRRSPAPLGKAETGLLNLGPQ